MEQSQRQQLAETLDLIGRQFPDGGFGRMVIGGTLSNTPESEILRMLLSLSFSDTPIFIDHFAEQQPELVTTFERTDASARLDYLLTTETPQFQVTDAIVLIAPGDEFLPRQASDHLLAIIAARLS
jgi:endonuclease/exonuclease/phosphatase family metal-dependent hydrolase